MNSQGLRSIPSQREVKLHDVTVNLFKGYLAANDQEFRYYIEQKKKEYKEGRDFSEDFLMVMAEIYTNCWCEQENEMLQTRIKRIFLHYMQN